MVIWGLTILLLYESTIRIINKDFVEEPIIMIITAGVGLICNISMAKVIHSSPGGHAGCDHGHSHDDKEGGDDHNHDHGDH